MLQIRKKFDTIETLKLLDDVASALTYAFSRGITHRDMKPTNILVSTQGAAKVTDYGLAQISARFVTEDDKANQQRTVDYAGLEKATDAPYGDVRSDIFFSGCVAYEMLTGRPPLALSRNKHARMARDRFMNLKKLGLEDIDGTGAEIVHRLVTTMMMLNPEHRYQTPAQLLDAVRQARAEVTGGTIGHHTAANTVFVAEGDEKLQDVMRDKLKKLGYRVLISGDPARAYDRYQQSPFEVLLLDIGTVGEEGLPYLHKVLRRARSVNHNCRAIVIFSEDQDELEGRIEFDVRGDTTVLRRPVKMNELTTKLRELLPPNTPEAA
jgi:serine/threonine protein kinase